MVNAILSALKLGVGFLPGGMGLFVDRTDNALDVLSWIAA